MSKLENAINDLATQFNVKAGDVKRVIDARKDETLTSERGDDVWFRFYENDTFTVTSNPRGGRLKDSFMFHKEDGFVSLEAYAKGIGCIYM